MKDESLVTWAHLGVPVGLCGIAFSLSVLGEVRSRGGQFTKEVPAFTEHIPLCAVWERTGQLFSFGYPSCQFTSPNRSSLFHFRIEENLTLILSEVLFFIAS